MNDEIKIIQESITQFISNKLIITIIGFILILIIKDLFSFIAVNLSDSLFYIFDNDFKPGKFILIDNEKVQIIKIGIIKTIVEDKTGNWRIIMNSRLKFLKIEKEFNEKGK